MRPLTDQAQALIASAPAHQVPQQVMERIVEMFTQATQHLDHLGYYSLRYPDQAWLSIRTPPSPQEPEGARWLPAFGHLTDAEAVLSTLSQEDTQPQIVAVEVMDLLFLCLGLSDSKGIVLYDTEGDRQTGKTISNSTLKHHLNQALSDLSWDLPPAQGLA